MLGFPQGARSLFPSVAEGSLAPRLRDWSRSRLRQNDNRCATSPVSNCSRATSSVKCTRPSKRSALLGRPGRAARLQRWQGRPVHPVVQGKRGEEGPFASFQRPQGGADGTRRGRRSAGQLGSTGRQEHQGDPQCVGGGWRNDRRCFAFKNPACRLAARQRSSPGTTECSLRTPVPTRWWGHCHRFHKSSSRSMAS
jgi:hypothetical protein